MNRSFAKGWLTIDAGPTPVLLAALGPRMLTLAGRVASGTSVGSHSSVCVTDDPEAVRSRSREHSQMYDSFPSYRAMLDREGVASGADLLLAGSFDRVAEGLAAYAAAGATDLRIMVHAGNDDERQATREALASALKRRLTA